MSRFEIERRGKKHVVVRLADKKVMGTGDNAAAAERLLNVLEPPPPRKKDRQ